MKRYGNLWPQIIAFENLFLAARKAEKGKRYRDNILAFNYDLEGNLIQLQQQLQDKTYRPGAYRTFYVMEPKRRQISAAPYRDRVVHHALCNVIVPIFERTFTDNCFANRIGYGTHRALDRFVNLVRSHRFVLQCDIKKYFPSIDREILKSLVRRKLKCRHTLWLVDAIIDNSNPQEPVVDYFPGDDLFAPYQRSRGLPIGNLTSQFFANVYLSGFDRFVGERFGSRYYVRYVDDFALFSDDRPFLEAARCQMEAYLATLRLKLHPVKTQIFETRHGASFLGFRVLGDRLRVRNENLRRGRRRLRCHKMDYDTGKIDLDYFENCLQSWVAHLNRGNTWRLQQKIFAALGLPRR